MTGVPENPVSISQGQTATAPTPPTLTGYDFAEWYTEEAATNPYDFSQVITANIDLYAKWTIQVFTVTYDVNKPSGATAEVTGMPNPVMINYNLTTTAPRPAPALDGYTFEGWYTEQAATTEFAFTTPITANIDLYAKWTAIQTFTVTYHDNKPQDVTAIVTGVPENPESISEGQTATAPTPPTLAGYNFVAWYTEAAATNQFDFSQGITANIDLYAKWTQDPVVSFNMQGGSPIDPQTLTGTSKRATRPDNPAREDYTFDNWYTQATGGALFDFSQTITAQSTTVYARWNRIIRTITYHGNKPDTVPSGVSVTKLPDPANVSSGDTATPPATPPVLQDYVFQGWFAGTTTGTILRLENTAFVFESTAIKADLLLYAKWTRTQITVTFHGRKPSTAPADASITGLATDPTIVTVNSGETTTALKPPPELTGYTLDGWYKATASTTGTVTLENTAFDFDQPIRGENINLYTKWLQQFTVTYYGNKPSDAPEEATVTGVPENPVSIPDGQTATPPTPPTLTGYNFVAWYTEATATNQFDFSQGITTSIELYAKWSQDPVVTFDTQGGSNIMSQTITRPTTMASRPDNPAREDYTFDNWYTMATGGALFDFTANINTSITVYARWNRIMRTITYHGNKPDTVPRGVSVSNLPDPATVNVDSGEMATAPATPPELQDYVFQGWFAGTISGGTLALQDTAFTFETTAIKENKDLYAKWNRKEITISFYGNKPSTAPEGATITGLTPNPKTVTVNSGETTTAPKPAPELTGYTLDGWFIGTTTGGTLTLQDTAFDFTTTTIRGGNINLYAKWTQNPIVTFDTQGGNNIDSQTITSSVTMAARPDVAPTREGYVFDNWYTMATGGDVFDFTRTITASITIYAQWIQQFTVTYHANKPNDAPEDATVTGVSTTPATVNSGDRITTPTDPTLANYNFVGWYTEEATTNQFNFSQVITTNIDLYAKWSALQTFTVTYNANKPTSAIDEVMGVPADIKVIINLATSEPSPEPTLVGYTFEGWYTEEAATNVFRFSTLITTNFDLYAKWTALQTFTVSYNANKPSGATANVAGMPTDVNVIINLATTEPSPEPTLVGYTFEGWYTEQATTTKFVFTRTITVNIDLYAKWTIQEFTVTYDVNKPSSATADVTGPPNPVMINYNLATAEPRPEPTLVGYTFEGWYTEQATTTKFVFTTPITEDKTLYAKWVFRPSTKAELVAEINRVITPTTPSPNLNYIDTSLINNMSDLFKDKSNFNGDISSWNVSLVQSMDSMFKAAAAFNGNISSWNVSKVTSMNSMFFGGSVFNGNISGWNVSLVEYMDSMFADAKLFNQNISSWNVSLVQTMASMFKKASKFNGNISSWNVSLVQNMNSMFSGASVFNGNISGWNVSLVKNMSNMFSSATKFNQNISSWNVSKVTNMSDMFSQASVFNQNISNWNVSKVTNMIAMFRNASKFNQNISSWNVSNVMNMSKMFSGATVFNGNISGWNVSLVENMRNMFFRATAFNQNISSWNVSKVANMSSMFSGATAFNQNISSWNVSKVTNMSDMFSQASVFNGNISGWDVAKVTKMGSMFAGAKLFNQNISSWNVNKVTAMFSMFDGARAFNQNLNNWNVSLVENMFSVFNNANAFNGNISSWNVSKVTNMRDMFLNATAFNGDISNWRPSALTNMSNMFQNASAFTQNIESWNIPSTVTKTGAFTGSGLEANLPIWAR